jgi:hypothetical protein
MREHVGHISEALRNTIQCWAIDITRMHEVTTALHQLFIKKRRIGRR